MQDTPRTTYIKQDGKRKLLLFVYNKKSIFLSTNVFLFVVAGKTTIVRKTIKNGQPEESLDSSAKEVTTKVEVKKMNEPSKDLPNDKKPKLKSSIKHKFQIKPIRTDGNGEKVPVLEEFYVETVLARRNNPVSKKKNCNEYLIKWEGLPSENNTWESAENLENCKEFLENFDKMLDKQKEAKDAKSNLAAKNTTVKSPLPVQRVIRTEPSKPGPSTTPVTPGRPMRSSKSKAMDQVKQWCGSMKEEDNDRKRRIAYSESDSDEGTTTTMAVKRLKNTANNDDEDDYTPESEEDRTPVRTVRAIHSNGSNKTIMTGAELVSTLGLDGKGQAPVLVANAKGVLKVDPKQMPNLTSGVYVMSRKDGIIKLDSSQGGKIVKGSQGASSYMIVQNRDASGTIRKQVVPASQMNSGQMTQTTKVITKQADGTQVVKVIHKPIQQQQQKQHTIITTTAAAGANKNEPVKIQPKPEYMITVGSQGVQKVVATPTTVRQTVGGQQQQQRQVIMSDGNRLLLPRNAQLRTSTSPATTTTSVLQAKTVVQKTPQRVVQQQQPAVRQVVRKITTSGTLTTVSQVSPGTTTTMARGKPTIVTAASQKTGLKVGNSPGQVKQSPQKVVTPQVAKKLQSVLTTQQQLAAAQRKAQQAAGVTPKTPLGRGAGVAARGMQRKSTVAVAVTQQEAKPTKETKLTESDSMHMEFHEVTAESDEGELDNRSSAQSGAPDSPPRPFTLCPLTGRIIGPDGQPIEQQQQQDNAETPTPTALIAVPTSQAGVDAAVVTSNSTTAELVLPSLNTLTEGGIMRVEMSPGGTTGTIVQTTEAPPPLAIATTSLAGSVATGLPCLDDTPSTSAGDNVAQATVASAAAAAPLTTQSSDLQQNIKQEIKQEITAKVHEDPTTNLVTITGEDGVVYQVAGQAEDGQTLLVTRGADGEQQCVYVTTTAEQQGEEGSVLTLDHAVAEAVAQLMPDQLTPQFFVKEGGEGEAVAGGDNQMVMSIMDQATNAATEDAEQQGQVVAQVIQADEPTPGKDFLFVCLFNNYDLLF